MCAPAAGRKLRRLRGLASASNRLAAARLACTACHTVRQRHSSAASTIAAMMPAQLTTKSSLPCSKAWPLQPLLMGIASKTRCCTAQAFTAFRMAGRTKEHANGNASLGTARQSGATVQLRRPRVGRQRIGERRLKDDQRWAGGASVAGRQAGCGTVCRGGWRRDAGAGLWRR
jgi:hypothetical protein